jgi:hypothetical protein
MALRYARENSPGVKPTKNNAVCLNFNRQSDERLGIELSSDIKRLPMKLRAMAHAP